MTTTTVDATVFRNVIGHFMTGVTVITARWNDTDFGMTASAVCSLSLDPAMVVVCLNRNVITQTAVSETGYFAVNILDEDQGWIAARFATPRDDKFAAVGVLRGEAEVPVIEESLAYLRCRVVEQVAAGTHTVFLAEVTEAISRDGSPLAYYRGTFGRFELEQHAEAYAILKKMVQDRRWQLEMPLEPQELSETTGLPVSAVHYGLTRLVGDGLVRRDSSGYLQEPFDAETARNSFEAKRIIDLAVADRTVGELTPVQLAELERLASRVNVLANESGIVDVNAYQAANADFQEYLISLAGNAVLVDAARRLSVPGVVAHAPALNGRIPYEMAQNREAMVAAYRSGDLVAVKKLMNAQADIVTNACLTAIESAGGRL